MEIHPLEPFLPNGARLLMMGSFPPPAARWSMEFYYPNFQNDMWRIIGHVFFNDKAHFVREKSFDKEGIKAFCQEKGIALYDTAHRVIREKGNASDKYLRVLEPVDLAGILSRIPTCGHVVVTGQKAAEILLDVLASPAFEQTPALPKVGGFVPFDYGTRKMKLHRMPSTSRAYPMSLEKKALFYKQLFEEVL